MTFWRALAGAWLMISMSTIALPAAAMQLLDAVDHGELSAEISATAVNRIALIDDRIARVVRAPDGFALEHDAASGDLWLRRQEPGHAGAVTLFLGSEKGFTYRLTLTPSDRDAAQILIRNAEAVSERAVPKGVARDPHIAALVKLVRAVARREPLAGYEILSGAAGLRPGVRPGAGVRLIETWRGPRFQALVLEADGLLSGGAQGLAGTMARHIGTDRVAALWLPDNGPKGLVVAVVESRGPSQ